MHVASLDDILLMTFSLYKDGILEHLLLLKTNAHLCQARFIVGTGTTSTYVGISLFAIYSHL